MALEPGTLQFAPNERPAAVVTAVQLPGVDDAELEASLVELERLARTLRLDPVGRVTQRRGSLAPGVVLGEGKLRELAAWTGGTGEVPAYEKPGSKRGDDDDDDDEDDESSEEAPKPPARAK